MKNHLKNHFTSPDIDSASSKTGTTSGASQGKKPYIYTEEDLGEGLLVEGIVFTRMMENPDHLNPQDTYLSSHMLH